MVLALHRFQELWLLALLIATMSLQFLPFTCRFLCTLPHMCSRTLAQARTLSHVPTYAACLNIYGRTTNAEFAYILHMSSRVTTALLLGKYFDCEFWIIKL